MYRSGEVETVKVHNFVPRRYKVVQNSPGSPDMRRLPPGRGAGSSNRRSGRHGAGPLELARPTITPFKHVVVCRGCLPRRAHVEQVHEEVIGERLWPPGEDAMLGLSEVGIQDAHTAKENCHLRSGQRQQLARSTSSSSAVKAYFPFR